MGPFKDIGVDRSGHVALIEIRRPPHNFFDIALIQEIAGALEALDADIGCRAVVLAAQGKSFCAGANFGDGATLEQGRPAAGRAQPRSRRATSLSRGQPAVPHQEADRRRRAWRRRRRRARPGDGGGLPRRLPRGALRRQFHAARLPSRLRPDGDAAGGDRRDESGADVLHQPPRHRRGCLCHGPCRRAGAARSGARGGAEARRRDRRERAARRWSRPVPRCAAISPTACSRRPSTSSTSRRGCARPTISRKASRRRPSAACRISLATDGFYRTSATARKPARSRMASERSLSLIRPLRRNSDNSLLTCTGVKPVASAI